MKSGGLKSSTLCLPMQKLGYQKMLKGMSNEPLVDLASSYHGEQQSSDVYSLICGLFGKTLILWPLCHPRISGLGLLFTIGCWLCDTKFSECYLKPEAYHVNTTDGLGIYLHSSSLESMACKGPHGFLRISILQREDWKMSAGIQLRCGLIVAAKASYQGMDDNESPRHNPRTPTHFLFFSPLWFSFSSLFYFLFSPSRVHSREGLDHFLFDSLCSFFLGNCTCTCIMSGICIVSIWISISMHSGRGTPPPDFLKKTQYLLMGTGGPGSFGDTKYPVQTKRQSRYTECPMLWIFTVSAVLVRMKAKRESK
jgi:hypothetical protein